MRTLLAGPWVGEFGWELFCWQGFIRKKSKEFDKTIIICRTGNNYLYSDFADVILNYDSPYAQSNMWMGAEINNGEVIKLVKDYNINNHILPFNIGFQIHGNDFHVNQTFLDQTFIKYDTKKITKSYDVLVHPRNKIIGHTRNWSLDNWKELIDKIKTKYTVAVIGGEESFQIEGVDSYRMVDLETLVSLFRNTKLAVGQSSGPLHLASLCGTPHLVWSDSSNKLRYEKYWNPHKTTVHFYDREGWNPKNNNIFEQIKLILK